jgi:hypothetical protein
MVGLPCREDIIDEELFCGKVQLKLNGEPIYNLERWMF